MRHAVNALAASALLAPLFLAGGCSGLDGLLEPGAISGLVTPQNTQQKLAEAEFPPEAATYAAANAYRTMDIPVRLNVPDRNLNFVVGSVMPGLLASHYIAANFAGGAIVEREFGKVLAANFRDPVGGEAPVAELAVRIVLAGVSQKSQTAPVTTDLKIHVEVVNPAGGGTACSERIETTATAPWTDRSRVPDSFYQALFLAVARFLDDWDRGDGPDTVARWAGDAVPGTAAPELSDIEWERVAEKGRVRRGSCTIACNGWEGFRTKHWANAQIAAACRTTLGNIETERVRVVYDDEDYDASQGRWTFSFRCFARSEKVLEYDAATGYGSVIGDLGLMKKGAEEATEDLKAYVFEEMRSHSGIVTSERRKLPESYIRFDGIRTDPAYNLVIIDFHLPR